MNSATDTQVSSTAAFNEKLAALLEDRETVKRMFCQSRLDLLIKAHEDSGSSLDLEAWAAEKHPLHNPWDQVVTNLVALRHEDSAWSILFVDEFFGQGRRNFVEYFNAFLREHGYRMQLVDIRTKVFFTS